MRRERERFKGVKTPLEIGHASTSGWFDWLGHKTWTKSLFEERERWFGGLCLKATLESRFLGLGLKTDDGQGVVNVRDGGHVWRTTLINVAHT